MKTDSRFKIALTALVLGLAIGAAVATTSARPAGERAEAAAPAAEPLAATQGRELLEQFSAAFHEAAKQVDRSVVAIASEQEVTTARFSPGPDDPFGPNGMLRRFFELPKGQEPMTRRSRSLGSGVIVRPDGYILTNDHVVRDSKKLSVEVSGKKYDATIVGTDPLTDLAVIKIDAEDLPSATLGNSDRLDVGQWVIAVGNPLELRHSVTAGIVSAKGRSSVGITAYEDFIQTDASINQGNSGGALADLDGTVVGINTAIASPNGGSVGIGFAIPINMARRVMDELIKDGRISRGYMALVPQDLDEDLAGALGLEGTHGALVGDVTPGGPADRAGVRRGDVILAVNGQPIEDANGLRNTVAALGPGSDAKIEVLRDGSKHRLSVELAERPETHEARTRPGAEPESPGRRLGMTLAPLTEQLAERLGYKNAEGVVVADVEPGGPAQQAGIVPGDLIVSVGRKEVHSVDELRQALRETEGGKDSVALLVQRRDRTLYVAVRAS